MKTKIVNATPHDFQIREGNGGVFRRLGIVLSMQSFIISFDGGGTYKEYRLISLYDNCALRLITSDELIDAAEFRVFKTPTQKFEWRVSKPRESIWDSTAFDAVMKDAS